MKFFSQYFGNKMFWITICGYGICGKDVCTHGLLFSERNGYKSILKIRNWCITFLKPWKFLKQKNDEEIS